MKTFKWKSKGFVAVLALALILCDRGSTGMAAESPAPGRSYSLNEILEQWKPKPLPQAIAAAENGDFTAQHFLGYYFTEGMGGAANYPEGLKWYQKAAEQKFPNSLNNIGVIYLNGRGVPKNLAEAKKYFRLAAEQGAAVSQVNLARIILYSDVSPSQEEAAEAMRWLQKAADSGNAEGQVSYGYLLMYPGKFGKSNPEKAIEVLQHAAAQGNLGAYVRLGDIYLDKRYAQHDNAKGVQYYQTGANLGNAICQSSLGWAYFNGIGVEQSQAKAVEWLLKSTAQTNLNAYHVLGQVYSGEGMPNRPKGFKPDYEKAAEWYQKAADAGHNGAAYDLGKIIWKGFVPWKQKADAVPLLEKAAANGDRAANELLQQIQMDLAANTKEEKDVLEKLSLEGNGNALERLASRYREVGAAKIDAVRVFRYEAAAQLAGHNSSGSILAQMSGHAINMSPGPDGKMTRTISKREKDFTPIYEAITNALKQDDAAYFTKLAQRYLDGAAVPKDVPEACVWLNFAASMGSAEAKQQVAELEAPLTPVQKANIQAWVRRLKAYQDFTR